jgi:hypothetical protein
VAPNNTTTCGKRGPTPGGIFATETILSKIVQQCGLWIAGNGHARIKPMSKNQLRWVGLKVPEIDVKNYDKNVSKSAKNYCRNYV